MLKHIAASQAAKTLALCVCPVVTAGVVATKVPQVRRAVHKATAPRVAERPKRDRAALSNAALPPCTPVAPFATLPRVAASLGSAVIPDDRPMLTPTSSPTADRTPQIINYPLPPIINEPIIGYPIGGGGGGNPPPGGGGGVVVPPTTSGVPEPETWLQVLAGFALAGGTIRYFRIRSKARIETKVA